MVGHLLLVLIALLARENLFNQPESVVFDVKYDRYLVSNKGDGSIVQVNTIDAHETVGTPSPVFEYFNTELSSIRGMHILNDTLFVASDSGVVGFDLVTAAKVMTVKIAEASFLNDITSDSKGFLYVSDSSASKIFKVDPALHTYSIFVGSGLPSPNGLLHDENNNRLIVCTWQFKAPIFEVSLDTGTVNQLIKTGLHNLDGLAFDSNGFIYVSSWGTNSVYRYDPDFNHPPVQVSKGHKGPADISYNEQDNLIAVPNFNANRVDYIEVKAFSSLK